MTPWSISKSVFTLYLPPVNPPEIFIPPIVNGDPSFFLSLTIHASLVIYSAPQPSF